MSLSLLAYEHTVSQGFSPPAVRDTKHCIISIPEANRTENPFISEATEGCVSGKDGAVLSRL